MTKKNTQANPDYQKQIEELKVENAQLQESLLRERADAMNVRKRAEDDRAKLGGFYKSVVIRELLPVIDNFERALKSVPKELEASEYMKGIQGTLKQFEQILSKLGVERIKTTGEHFNPHTMEAVSMEEGDGEHEIVSEELQSGYLLGDEVIRHAMVRVKS